MIKDLITHLIYTLTEPFIILGCREANRISGGTIGIAPLDSLAFETISATNLDTSLADVSYDPVDQKVYFATSMGVFRINLNGTNEEHIINGKSDQAC